LQPLSDLHFNADYSAYDSPTGNKPTLYGLLAVAAFLLILGCINFINLTTAHASQRAKEIGIRKTMGGSKKQLIVQFLSETFLLTFIATVLSVVLTPLILKAFAGFIPKDLHFSLTEQPGIILFLVALMAVVTLLSGFYPAIILSGYKPVLVLKNQAYGGTGKTRKAWLRKSLTISQFVIAQVFIMATILVSKQIHYSLNKDMGFKKDAIIYFNTNYYDTVSNHKAILMDKLKAIPGIAMVSLCTNPPSSNNTWSGTMKYKDGKREIESDVQQKYGDSNYIKLYGLKLLAGKNITTTDTVTSYLINETFAHILGFQKPQQAIGKYIEWSDKQIPITGVVSDFIQRSLHEPVKPLAIASWNNPERNFSMALQPQNEAGTAWKNTITKIEKAFKEVYPEDDFEYSFFDEDIAKYYRAEQNISSLLKWTAGLAIFISCLGLLGLVIYTTTQRTKEVGVRKVLGASVSQIVSLISKDFILLVLFAFLIATPVAWIGMNRWLQNFAFRTEISWWIFLSGAAIMIVIALLTLGFQTIKAAIANPVKSLRTE
jgi:ABC-type antimicrobial peptide transport system permease subunit